MTRGHDRNIKLMHQNRKSQYSCLIFYINTIYNLRNLVYQVRKHRLVKLFSYKYIENKNLHINEDRYVSVKLFGKAYISLQLNWWSQ